MFKSRFWFKGDVFLFSVAFVALLFAVAPMSAHAGDSSFKSMGLTGRFVLAASPNNVLTISGVADDSANNMPDAFLMWTASGSPVWIRRNTTSLTTFETNSLKIPSNQSLVITPFGPIRVSTTYFNSFEVVGTVGDTLFYNGLER